MSALLKQRPIPGACGRLSYPDGEKYHQDPRQHLWHSCRQWHLHHHLSRAFRQANPGKRLIVVLDNFSSHHAVLVKAYAANNNIQLVYLPPYSPDLNPIEQIWRAIKREVAATFIMNYEHLTTVIARAFEKLAAKRSYREKWVIKFLSPKYASKMLSD